MGDLFAKVVGRSGQIVIPEGIRVAHGLEQGDVVLLELHGLFAEGEVERPALPETQQQLPGFLRMDRGEEDADDE